ncbi:MAG: acyltransferase [Prevotella sp.]|nr:acyltransferase [Prevotella sp.]
MIATLQSLRFVFVLLIFLSHFTYGNFQALDAGGDCGVAFFFLLSGFTLSLGYGESLCNGSFRYKAFLCRRLRKIYPLHLLCLLFFLLVSGSPINGRVVLNALLLQSWIPDANYYFSCNSVSWFLSTLLFCYLLFPLAWRYASKKELAVVLVAYVVVCCMVPYNQVNAILYVHPLVRFVDFYMGIVLYRLYSRYAATTVLPSWVEWALVFLLLLSLAVYSVFDAKFRNAPMYWLVLIPFVWVFAQAKGSVSRLLSTRPMLWLGSLSMPFFLTHQMLLGILIHRLPVLPGPLMLAICLAAVLTVSWMVEIIFLRLFR